MEEQHTKDNLIDAADISSALHTLSTLAHIASQHLTKLEEHNLHSVWGQGDAL